MAQQMFVEGSADPKPYKVDRVTEDGRTISKVAAYATEAEAMAYRRRLDWSYRVWGPVGRLLWPHTGAADQERRPGPQLDDPPA